MVIGVMEYTQVYALVFEKEKKEYYKNNIRLLHIYKRKSIIQELG